jgi:hypothetical protein
MNPWRRSGVIRCVAVRLGCWHAGSVSTDIALPAGVADALRAVVAGVPPKHGVGVFAGMYLAGGR